MKQQNFFAALIAMSAMRRSTFKKISSVFYFDKCIVLFPTVVIEV